MGAKPAVFKQSMAVFPAKWPTAPLSAVLTGHNSNAYASAITAMCKSACPHGGARSCAWKTGGDRPTSTPLASRARQSSRAARLAMSATLCSGLGLCRCAHIRSRILNWKCRRDYRLKLIFSSIAPWKKSGVCMPTGTGGWGARAKEWGDDENSSQERHVMRCQVRLTMSLKRCLAPRASPATPVWHHAPSPPSPNRRRSPLPSDAARASCGRA